MIYKTYQSLCSIGCKTASSEAAQQEIENEIEVWLKSLKQHMLQESTYVQQWRVVDR